MRHVIASIIFLFPILLFGQTFTPLKTQDGLAIQSSSALLERTDKRDKYRVVIKAINSNQTDVFYAVAKKPQPNGTTGLGKSDPKHFALIMLTNPGSLKDFMGGTIKLSGDQTSELTGRDEILFRIPGGACITGEMTVYVRSGKQPELSCEMTGPLRPREAFHQNGNPTGSDIPGQTPGNPNNLTWTSSCNGSDHILYRRPAANGRTELVMTSKGRQIIWQQTATGVFEKPGQTNARITHEPVADIYTYTHIDGAVCLWRKR